MLLATTILYQALLATAALAAVPARRTSRTHQRTDIIQSASSESTDSSLSANWAGAVLVEPTATYTSASGTFVIPTVTLPSNNTPGTTYTGAIWVGIDGETCGTSILQAGIEIWIDDSGATANPVGIADISFGAGDSVTVTVTASSTTGGTAIVENTTKGQTETYIYSDQTDHPLCEYNAEWIVGAYDENGDLIPFFVFDTIAFTEASATTADGTTVDTSGATLFDIERTQVLISTSASGSTITIYYIA
ncbi:concanavalin A-like lectin/glucanase [Peniophora sp. CONT]|nr:concanavalin A-like lectin/glucanase [Peniophora sp. CONT]